MLDALKKMDKKFLIFVACIFLLPILIVIFLVLFRSCDTTKISHEAYEKRMVQAAQKYIKKKDVYPETTSDVISVSLDTLVDEGYIKSTNKLLDDSDCTGDVKIRHNGVVSSDKTKEYNYIPNLRCKNYTTKSLFDLIKKDIADDAVNRVPGLYFMNGKYVFRGDSVNNNVSLYGILYRILNVDENGVAKLLRVESEPTNAYWDKKYNTETNDITGQNIYADSNILKKLNEIYTKIKPVQKEKLIASNVCIGKRNLDDDALYSESDCSEILESQYISLANVTDFAIASLDPNCTNIYSKSCRNYNYLHYLNISTWTVNGVGDNTYEAYLLSNGNLFSQEANQYDFYNVVLYIDASEIVKSGDGTIEKPYVIE